jgi:hypothetical protein
MGPRIPARAGQLGADAVTKDVSNGKAVRTQDRHCRLASGCSPSHWQATVVANYTLKCDEPVIGPASSCE